VKVLLESGHKIAQPDVVREERRKK
jgi:hypothetical protein